jgi:hypothetical protein
MLGEEIIIWKNIHPGSTDSAMRSVTCFRPVV